MPPVADAAKPASSPGRALRRRSAGRALRRRPPVRSLRWRSARRAHRRRSAGRALVAALAVAAIFGGLATREAAAHAVLVGSDPTAGAALGAAPAEVRLTFSERVAPSLSDVRVLDESGAAQQSGPAAAVPGASSSLRAPLRPLRRGVYTVTWRGVSAVDGHATSGSFAFGVRERPTGQAARATSSSPGGSTLELLARFALIGGLVALLGAAVAGAAGYAGSTGSELRLAAGGWAAAVVGLLGLAEAQRRAAGAPLGELLRSDVGEALIERAVAILVAGVALLAAASRPAHRRAALGVAAVAAAGAMATHVAAGHAAAGNWPNAIGVGAQWAHFVAAGVWIGGLAALLLGIRGAPSEDKAVAVRRFAIVALAGIVVVALAGTIRAIDELQAVDELWSSAYGRAIVAKVALLVAIAALAARNRRVAHDLGPLRRTSRAELSLAAVAIAVAALLGTIAPPVAGDASPGGLRASGSDFATTTRVKLTTASSEPGANRFVARVTDYDSGAPVRGARVSVRFEPLDDPGVAATTLRLAPTGDGTYAGAGANLAFDGRWRATVLVQGADDAVEVPLELDVPGPEHFVSVERFPGRPPAYTAQVVGVGFVRISPSPERAGPGTLTVGVYTPIQEPATIDDIAVTAAAGGAPPRRLQVTRRGRGRFSAPVTLAEGANEIVVVARDRRGTRLRTVFELDVPD